MKSQSSSINHKKYIRETKLNLKNRLDLKTMRNRRQHFGFFLDDYFLNLPDISDDDKGKMSRKYFNTYFDPERNINKKEIDAKVRAFFQ